MRKQGSHYFACESGGCRQREGVHRLCECVQLVVELNGPTRVSYPLSTVRACVRAMVVMAHVRPTREAPGSAQLLSE